MIIYVISVPICSLTLPFLYHSVLALWGYYLLKSFSEVSLFLLETIFQLSFFLSFFFCLVFLLSYPFVDVVLMLIVYSFQLRKGNGIVSLCSRDVFPLFMWVCFPTWSLSLIDLYWDLYVGVQDLSK